METITFSKDWIENNVGFIEKEDPTLSPYQRFKRVRNYFRKYFPRIKTNFCEIEFNEQMLNLNQLNEFIRRSYRLLPPILSFSKRDIMKQTNDPRGIFKYGGYVGEKNIYITKIICPQHISNDDIEEFLISLKRVYDASFGTLEYDSMDNIRLPYSQSILNMSRMKVRDILKSKISSITLQKKENYVSMVIVVTPNRKNVLHYYTRELIINYWETADQHLKLSTFKKIKHSDLPIARAFALQLYIKSLRSDEESWILRYPSDKNGETIYCGVGYSMRAEKEDKPKKGVGVFAICDAQGKYTFQKNLSLSQASYYLSEELLFKIFEFIKEKIHEVDFKRIVLYKKGHLTTREKATARKFIDEIRKIDYWKDKNIDVITVEESLQRLFKIKNNKIYNVDSGTTLVLNNDESLICSSGHPERGVGQGTTKLLKLRKELASSEKEISELTSEYYDRIFLNWMSPVTPSKYPPELNISSNIAEIIKEVDIRKDFPCLVV